MTRPMPGPPEHCCCRDGDQPCGLWLDGGADLYPWYPRDICPGCDLHNGRSESHDKRLTDAECAAEYWRAVAERLEFDADVNCGYETHDETLERFEETWRRFARTPHALEES